MDAAGEIIVFTNAYAYMQVLAYSTQLSGLLIVGRIKQVEYKNIRKDACESIINLLEFLAIGLDKITIVINLYWCTRPKNTISGGATKSARAIKISGIAKN